MYMTVYESDFRTMYEGTQYKNNFSPRALSAMFDYFEEYEESTGEPFIVDPVGIAVEFTEISFDRESDYADAPEFDGSNQEEILEYFQDYTTVIPVDEDSFVIADY